MTSAAHEPGAGRASSSPPGRSRRHSPGSGRPGVPGPRRPAGRGAAPGPGGAGHVTAPAARVRPLDGGRLCGAGSGHLRRVRGPARIPGRGRRGADGHRAGGHGRPGDGGGMPTGGVLPPGADAVVMVEYTQEAMPGTIEVTRPVAPGEGVVRADEDAAAGDELVPAGARCAPRTWACWPPPGSRGERARPAPGDGVLHRRRGGAAGDAGTAPGQVRDATATALAALISGGGRRARARLASSPTTGRRWRPRCAPRCPPPT